VPAGNDVFDPELVRAYFEEYCKDLGISFRVLLGYGRINPRDQAEPFGMTVLALRLSSHCNGVSRLHGEVSRTMWQAVWPHHPVEDVPIDHITNGIHVPTWISPEMAELFDRYMGPNWSEDPDNEKVWEHIEQIPDTELWRTHERRRAQLVGFTRERLRDQLESRGASQADLQRASEVLSPDVLTIGFARRFATYKRATLLFRDPDRLAAILNNPDRPVQIIIAGKAHPADNEGKQFIRKIFDLVRQERFRRRVVFLEDYNILMAQHLVTGADIWLNTPRRPLEACGTSGMKALANGCLNMSVLDGWWDEAYFRDYGWALGHGEVYQDLEFQDDIESRSLYDLLEREVTPLFYARGAEDLPRGWVDMMRAGLRRLVPVFNAHRMVQEYTSRFYVPCSRSYNAICADDFHAAEELAVWRNKLMTSWQEVSVAGVSTISGTELEVGGFLEVSTQVRLGSLTPDDVTVEAYFGAMDSAGDFSHRDTALMEAVDSHDGLYNYTGKVPCLKTGRFGFTVRVTPSHKRLENRFAMGLVTWAE
jgi:starch phosphorylase